MLRRLVQRRIETRWMNMGIEHEKLGYDIGSGRLLPTVSFEGQVTIISSQKMQKNQRILSHKI